MSDTYYLPTGHKQAGTRERLVLISDQHSIPSNYIFEACKAHFCAANDIQSGRNSSGWWQDMAVTRSTDLRVLSFNLSNLRLKPKLRFYAWSSDRQSWIKQYHLSTPLRSVKLSCYGFSEWS
jgi:hypothetical protein